jgi:hypothetical protein
MERTAVEHHDQGVGDFAIHFVELELESATRSAGGVCTLPLGGLRLRRGFRTAGITATYDRKQEDQPEDGDESGHPGSLVVH